VLVLITTKTNKVWYSSNTSSRWSLNLPGHPRKASPANLRSTDADHCFSYDTTEVQVKQSYCFMLRRDFYFVRRFVAQINLADKNCILLCIPETTHSVSPKWSCNFKTVMEERSVFAEHFWHRGRFCPILFSVHITVIKHLLSQFYRSFRMFRNDWKENNNTKCWQQHRLNLFLDHLFETAFCNQ